MCVYTHINDTSHFVFFLPSWLILNTHLSTVSPRSWPALKYQMWYSWQGASSELFMDYDPYPYCTSVTPALIKLSTWLLPHCYCYCPVCQRPEVLCYLSGTDISGDKKHHVPMGIAINQNWTGYQNQRISSDVTDKYRAKTGVSALHRRKWEGGCFCFHGSFIVR